MHEANSSHSAINAANQPLGRISGAAPGNATLLVVDDDAVTFATATRVARDLGLSVRCTSSMDTALELARVHHPFIVLAAIEIGGSARGLSFGRLCNQRYDSVVVFVGQQLLPQQVGPMAAVRPAGFLCKPLRADQFDATLRLAICQRHADAHQTPNDQREDLARALRQIAAVVSSTGLVTVDADSPASSSAMLSRLRPREQEIVHLLFAHCRVPGIASRLGISPQTVRNHLKHIFQTLGVHSQEELIGLLRSQEPLAQAASAS